jgi:hypothetical protein
MTDVSEKIFATSDKVCTLPYISEAVAQHRAHKERLRRIANRAVQPPAPQAIEQPAPIPTPREGVRVVNRFGRVSFLPDKTIRETNARFPISVATIQTKVAEAYGQTRAEMMCPQRSYAFSLARHIAIYLSKQLKPSISLPELGRHFDRDHTTILHGARRIGQMVRLDPGFADKIETLKASIIGERAAE